MTERVIGQPSQKKTFWAFMVATFFGSGWCKPAPGTWGSGAALLLWAAYGYFAHPSPHALVIALLIGTAVSIIFGVPAATIASRESGMEDPRFVVIDEVAGQWIALIGSAVTWQHGLLALFLFRFFDVLKPYPIRKLEKLPEGWGIVFDDVLAGIYALVVATVLHRWI